MAKLWQFGASHYMVGFLRKCCKVFAKKYNLAYETGTKSYIYDLKAFFGENVIATRHKKLLSIHQLE